MGEDRARLVHGALISNYKDKNFDFEEVETKLSNLKLVENVELISVYEIDDRFIINAIADTYNGSEKVDLAALQSQAENTKDDLKLALDAFNIPHEKIGWFLIGNYE